MEFIQSLRKALVTFAAVLIIGSGLTACAQFDQAKQSDAFKKFCSWAPVAVKGIHEAALEAAKDPVKLQIATAMREANGYLQMVSAQCEAPIMAVK